MAERPLGELLSNLHKAILRERECAKSLELEEMMTATREKEKLLQAVGPVQELSQPERSLIEKIQHENRRNAYLFLSTLNWIRETMQFFGKQVTPVSYSARGGAVKSHGGGRLLSGKI